MRFSTWHSADQLDRIPHRPGLFQVRRSQGLLQYPRGKSAMYLYGIAPLDLHANLRNVFLQLEANSFWGRYTMESLNVDLSSGYRRLMASFVDRFGAAPLGNIES